MFLNQPDDDQLVALWHGRETCPVIARRLGVNPTWLRLQWRRLRYNGKIPKDGRRNARVIREDDDDAANDHLDGRPSLAARDRLLQRPISVHNEPRFDLFTLEETRAPPSGGMMSLAGRWMR